MNNSNYLSHYGILGMRWGRRKGPKTKVSKPKKQSFVKAAIKDAWERTPPADKAMATVGATIAMGYAAYGAIKGAGVLGKTLKSAAKDATYGRKVAYSVLDEFGRTIIKGRTGVL